MFEKYFSVNIATEVFKLTVVLPSVSTIQTQIKIDIK